MKYSSMKSHLFNLTVSRDTLILLLVLSSILRVCISDPGSGGTNSFRDCVNAGSVQLVDGRSGYDYEGRVEVCHDGEWKTVCDEDWDHRETQVVCRQLGYPNSSNAIHIRRGCTGQGSGGIVVARWICYGNESRLLDCRREGNQSACDHRRDAGVYCSGQREDDCDLRSLRLVDGTSNESGRVEICRFGCWGTVCDEGWDRDDAIVTCRQLGFETASAIPTRGAYFGEGRTDRPIFLSQVKCDRNSTESELLSCPNSGIDHHCLHSQDAGVICHGPSMCMDGEVRLVGARKNEREGRVEICYNGVWGAMCANNGWDEIAARIVCSQLGYGRQGLSLSISEPGSSPALLVNVTCDEKRSMLFQCVDLRNSVGVQNCEENNIAGVICQTKSHGEGEGNDMDSSTQAAGIVGSSIALGLILTITVIMLIIILLYYAKRKRRGINENTVVNEIANMKENEAYVSCNVIATQENEAYGTLMDQSGTHS